MHAKASDAEPLGFGMPRVAPAAILIIRICKGFCGGEGYTYIRPSAIHSLTAAALYALGELAIIKQTGYVDPMEAPKGIPIAILRNSPLENPGNRIVRSGKD